MTAAHTLGPQGLLHTQRAPCWLRQDSPPFLGRAMSTSWLLGCSGFSGCLADGSGAHFPVPATLLSQGGMDGVTDKMI